MNGLVSLEDASYNTRELTPVSDPCPTRLEASRVQPPVNVLLDDLALPVDTLEHFGLWRAASLGASLNAV